MAAFNTFVAFFCVVVCSSFTVSLACEVPDLLKIVEALREVDWEELADLLDVGGGAVRGIKGDCVTRHHGDLAVCHRMKLVEHYCEKTARTPRQVADDMADVLETYMSRKIQAGKLRQLTLSGSADRHPSPPSDSTYRDLQEIVGVLEEVMHWEILSIWLDVQSGVRRSIKEHCRRQSADLGTCYRTKLVEHYCEKTARSPRQVADDMADVLETHMSKTMQAVKLRQLTFNSTTLLSLSDSRKPTGPSTGPAITDTIVGLLEGYWVSIAVALALVAVTTCISWVCTRAGPLHPLPGVPPAAHTIIKSRHYPTPDERAHDVTVDPPTLADLLNELREVEYRWRAIAILLGLNGSSIERILVDNNRVDDCMMEVLSEWKNTETSPYTWHTIVEVLESRIVNEQRLAKEIRKKHNVIIY